jgi:hypothetical protein
MVSCFQIFAFHKWVNSYHYATDAQLAAEGVADVEAAVGIEAGLCTLNQVDP